MNYYIDDLKMKRKERKEGKAKIEYDRSCDKRKRAI